jgi:hypothetical protein
MSERRSTSPAWVFVLIVLMGLYLFRDRTKVATTDQTQTIASRLGLRLDPKLVPVIVFGSPG